MNTTLTPRARAKSAAKKAVAPWDKDSDQAAILGSRPHRGSTARHPATTRRRRVEQLAARLHALRQQPIEYMPHPSFDDPQVVAELDQPWSPICADLGALPPAAEVAPNSCLVRLGDTALLKPTEEAALFRRMNLLKHYAARLLGELDGVRVSERQVARVETLLTEACAVRNHIMQANLRLVVSVAKGFVAPDYPLPELVSDGNMSLLRAIEKFDFARGFRFSTYGTWALRKNYQRALGRSRRERGRMLLEEVEIHNVPASSVDDDAPGDLRFQKLRSLVRDILERLDPRERSIVSARFGLGSQGEIQTLSQLGVALGISKERVRQLECRALDKLRSMAGPLAALT